MPFTQNGLYANIPPVYPVETGASERLYKACRTCRRQKMRCDGAVGNPCRRCRNSGVECVFEVTATRRRQTTSGNSPKRQRLQALTQEVGLLKDQVALLTETKRPTFSPTAVSPAASRVSGDRAHSSTRTSSQLVPSETATDDNNVSYHDLSTDNLGNPVSAVHVMMHPPKLPGEPERNTAGWTIENQSRWHRDDPSKLPRKDIVARNVVQEIEARYLFDLFMQGCNIWLPVFDPVIDTYDSIREQSSFMFTVILLVAARQRYIDDPTNRILITCEEEAQWLAADSLFKNPTSLETTEAMAILAIHSEKMWFALGHALQMAYDLTIKEALRRLVKQPGSPSATPMTKREGRYDAHCARVWLIIVQYDRAVAFGTVRPARTEKIAVSVLERFQSLSFSRPSDVSFCAPIDLLQICSRLQQGHEVPTLQRVETELETWHRRWDTFCEENCVHPESFQRTHIRIQMLYAKVFQGGKVLVRLLKSYPTTAMQAPGLGESPKDVSAHILRLTGELLMLIDKSASYKRLFKWAPTYEGVLLTFVVIIGFKILLMYPDLRTQIDLITLVEPAALLLKQHPCQSFYQVARRLINRARLESAPSPSQYALGIETSEPFDIAQYGFDWTSIWPGENWAFDISQPVPDFAD